MAKGTKTQDACDEGVSKAESTQRKADERAHSPLPTTIFSNPFHGAIKGYSEPPQMPSILIEKETEHLSLKPLQE